MTQSRLWWIAAGVSLLVTFLAMLFRPLWLDEYWTLYISGYDTTWEEMARVRMMNDIHPPLAYYPLHVWNALFQSDLASRFLNFVYIGAAFAGAAWIGRDRKEETTLYLLLCVTAFWFTFYVVEIRNYALLYALSVAAVPALRRAIEGEKLKLGWLALWVVLAMAISMTHYYGTLLVGATGLLAGILMLAARRPLDFVIIGIASMIAVAPAVAYVVAVGFGERVTAAQQTGFGYSWTGRMYGALVQSSRAMFGKTLLGNLPAWIAALMALGFLMKKRERNDVLALGAGVGTVLLAIAIMAVFPSEMRERSFTGVVPPLMYFVARGLMAANEKGGRAAWFGKWAPWMAMLAPIVFIPEHFKDRQMYPQVRAYLADAKTCGGQPVLATLIPMPQSPGYPLWYANHALMRTEGGPPVLVDAAKAGPEDLAKIEASPCPVKAIALALARGEGRDQERARDGLRVAGFDPAAHDELALGKGRNLLWIPKGMASATMPDR